MARRRKRLIRRHGAVCSICKGWTGQRIPLTVDHILPLSRGGTNDDENLRLVCISCHRTLNEFDQCRAVVVIALVMGAAWGLAKHRRKLEARIAKAEERARQRASTAWIKDM